MNNYTNIRIIYLFKKYIRQVIKTETEELLGKMITKFEVEVTDDGGVFQVIIKTDEEVSTVIGRHGETIRAIQKILEVILYKKFNERVEILVNVNDFREKQKKRLETMAREYARSNQSSRNSRIYSLTFIF